MPMSTAVKEEKESAREGAAKIRRQYVSFSFYEVDRSWRRLPRQERQESKEEFQRELAKFVDSKQAQVLTFSCMGMKADADFLLWIISYEIDVIQKIASRLLSTRLGQYLKTPHSFLSMTKRSNYMDRFHPEHPEDRAHLIPGKYKYFFVYPFVKKRDWYLLPFDERQKMMDEHIRIGMKYPSVKLNTTYSFGLDDQEFVVAFETDEPGDFLDLVQELRESQGSAYTLRDTPIFSCIAMNTREMLDSLGG
jgi:chlorite dismutase